MRRRHSQRRTRPRSNESHRIGINGSRSRSSAGGGHSSLLFQNAGTKLAAISFTAPRRPASVSGSMTGVSRPASVSGNMLGPVLPTTSSGTMGGRRRKSSLKSVAARYPHLGIGLPRRRSSQSGSIDKQRERRQGPSHSTTLVPSHGRRIPASTQPGRRLASFNRPSTAASSSAMQDLWLGPPVSYVQDKGLTDVYDQAITSESVASTLKPVGGTMSASIGTSLLSEWPERFSTPFAEKQQLSTDRLPVRNGVVQRSLRGGICRSNEKGTTPTQLVDGSMKQTLAKRFTGSKMDITGTADYAGKLGAGKADIMGMTEVYPALKPAEPSASAGSIDVVLQLKFKGSKEEPERTEQAAEQAQDQKSSQDGSEAWVVEYTESLLSTVPEVKELRLAPHESLFTSRSSSEPPALSVRGIPDAQHLTSLQTDRGRELLGAPFPKKLDLDTANAIQERTPVEITASHYETMLLGHVGAQLKANADAGTSRKGTSTVPRESSTMLLPYGAVDTPTYGAPSHATAIFPPQPHATDLPVTGTELVPRNNQLAALTSAGTGGIASLGRTPSHMDTYAAPMLFSPEAQVPRVLDKSPSKELVAIPTAPAHIGRVMPVQRTRSKPDLYAAPVLSSQEVMPRTQVRRMLDNELPRREPTAYPTTGMRLGAFEFISVPLATTRESTETSEHAASDSIFPASPPLTDASHVYEEPSPSPGGLFHMTPPDDYDEYDEIMANKPKRKIEMPVSRPCRTETVASKPAEEKERATLEGAEQSARPVEDGGGVIVYQHKHQQRQVCKESTEHTIGEVQQEDAKDRGPLLAVKRTEIQYFKKATEISKRCTPEHSDDIEVKSHQVKYPLQLSPSGHTVLAASGDDDSVGVPDVESANSKTPGMLVPRDDYRHTQVEVVPAQDIIGTADTGAVNAVQGLGIDQKDLKHRSPICEERSLPALTGHSTMSAESEPSEVEPHRQFEHDGKALQPFKEENIMAPSPMCGNITEVNRASGQAESVERSRALAQSFMHQELKSTLESLSESCPREVKEKITIAYETFAPPEVEDTSLDDTGAYDPQLQVREADDYDLASIMHEHWEDTSTTVASTMKTFFNYNPRNFMICVNEEGVRCGIIGIMVFEDEVAFCGFNLIRAEFRRRGVRRMLWDNMLAFDTGKNIFTIVPAERVYAYHKGLGFHTSREGLVLHGKLPPCNDLSTLKVPPKGGIVVKPFNSTMLPELSAYDKSVLGFGRKHFWDLTLQEDSLTINVAVSGKEVRGYAGIQEDVRGTLMLRWLFAEDTNTSRLLLYSLLNGSKKFIENGLWVAFHVCSPAARSVMQYFDTTPLKPWMLIFNRREPFFRHESVIALTYI